jgi:signal transduction histidine kinase
VFPLGLPLLMAGVIASRGLEPLPLFVIWTALFFAAPRLTNLVLSLDIMLMRRLLGPSEDSLRIRELEQTRSHAINEAASTLRRIERDLHDGAQARLVALGMQLGRAERQLERGNTDSGMALLRSSRDEARSIVQDLREMVRGIHPPALDSGLEPALTTLAAKTSIPTTVRVMVRDRLSAAAETMLYFAAAELLTNAAKHSGAQSIAITVIGDALADVQLIVTDDGRGGASLNCAGSGLRGLAERIRTVDGQLSVLSPIGGPTTVTVWLPAEPGRGLQEGN